MSDNYATSDDPKLRLYRANNDIATVSGALQAIVELADEKLAGILTACCYTLSDAQDVISELVEAVTPPDGSASESPREVTKRD